MRFINTVGNHEGIKLLHCADELVCIYQNRNTGDCDIKYEVCSENPLFVNRTAERHICHAVFIVDMETGSHVVNRDCFDDPHSLCPEERVPELHATIPNNIELYTCCCVSNLCNRVNYTGT